MSRVALLCRDSRGRVDAIGDATACLAATLRHEGFVADVVLRDADGTWHTGDRRWVGLLAASGDYEALVLQYNPFLYGRRGFAPWLVRDFLRLRARRRRPVLVLYVHEPAMPLIGLRKTLMGLWQRLQLRALRFAADRIFVTTEAWTAELASMHPRRRVSHLPVGSTLPDMRSARAEARASLAVDPDELVVATLSSGHESHLLEYVAAAVDRIAKRTPALLLLALGAGASEPPVNGVRVMRPGELPPGELAALVAASDLFLVPLVDGASTRRTSMMTALQHGVAVIATDGPLTDSILRGGAVAFAPVGDIGAFADTAAGLAADSARRIRLAAAGRELYRRSFDWPALARSMAPALSRE